MPSRTKNHRLFLIRNRDSSLYLISRYRRPQPVRPGSTPLMQQPSVMVDRRTEAVLFGCLELPSSGGKPVELAVKAG